MYEKLRNELRSENIISTYCKSIPNMYNLDTLFKCNDVCVDGGV